MKAYIAAPFFNPAQTIRVEQVKSTLSMMGWAYFSPKDANLWKPGDDAIKVLNGNTDAINACDALVVITDDKDTGTMFEAGYAHAKGMPIIYVWFTRTPGQKFNVMLGVSGAVTYNLGELTKALDHVRVHGKAKIEAPNDLE
jgi:nucleoside 2-deoxyribosyltransferase